MQSLTQREAEFIEALGETVFPRAGGVDRSADDAGVATYVDRWMTTLPRVEQLKMKALFRMFDYGYAVRAVTPRARFATAEGSERDAYLRSWADSPTPSRRAAYQALRSVMLIAWLDDDAVRTSMDATISETIIKSELDGLEGPSEAVFGRVATAEPSLETEPVTEALAAPEATA